jgi:predicted nuclease of predicted toxin-antitoxin system
VTRFVVDAQLPPALARLLDARGFPAEHVHDLGLGSAADDAIWDYALRSGGAVISKDEDFANRIALDPDGPAIGSWFGSPVVPLFFHPQYLLDP